MGLKGHTTDKGLEVMRNHLKEKIKHFVLIGDEESNNEALDKLVSSSSTEYKDIESYIFCKSDIGAAYYDKDSILTFVLPIDHESSYTKYIYAVAIIDTDNVLAGLVATPKMVKLKGIGGNITYKVGLKGEAGSIVFEKFDITRASQEDAEGGADNFKLMTSLRTKQYVDKRLASDDEAVKGEDEHKLLTPKSLKKVIDASVVPVGFIYTQFPEQLEPSELFGGTWSNISDKYAGRFFRAEGGLAASFSTPFQDAKTLAHSHKIDHDHATHGKGAFSNRYLSNKSSTFSGGGYSYFGEKIGAVDTDIRTSTYEGSTGEFGGDENRPINATIRIWKKIA